MTGGATAGTTSTTSTKKALWWIVIAIVGLIALIWVTFKLKGKGPEIVRFVTESPTDIVEGPPGVFHRRGESAQTIAERSARNNLPLVGRIYAPGSTFKLDGGWQGVACFDVTKRIKGSVTSRDTWTEVRCDQNDQLIFKIPPSNHTEPTTVKVPDSNILEWRIMGDQTNLNPQASVETSTIDKPR